MRFTARRRGSARWAVLGLVMAGGCSLALGLASAHAASTKVAAASGDEAGHAAVFSHALGGAFEFNNLNIEGSGVTARRIDDDSDRYYDAGKYEVAAVGSFAEEEQSFGYLTGASGGSYDNLFDIDDRGLGLSNSSVVELDESFRWARAGEDEVHTTSPADNDSDDRAVTYVLEGGESDGDRYVFFEDEDDNDYQDLIVRVRSLTVPEPVDDTPTGEVGDGLDDGADDAPSPPDNVNSAPTPSAAAGGAMLLLGALFYRRRGQQANDA